MRKLIAADLFCGAGGLSWGFKDAGFTIAFANDINPDYLKTYKINHPGTILFEKSIEELSASKIYRETGIRQNEIDVLIGGPPCQGFSINAPKRSIHDSRNHLFREYGRIVLEGLRPKVIVMENVPGILSLEGGGVVAAVYDLFESAGYQISHKIICSAHYGVPQERWRVFFIGTNIPVEISFPEPVYYAPVRANFNGGRNLTWLSLITKDENPKFKGRPLKRFVSVAEAIGDLPPLSINEGAEEMEYASPASTPYQRAMRSNSKKLYNHVAGFLSKQNLERLEYVNPGGSWRQIPYELLPLGMKRARRSDHTKRYGRIHPGAISGTILTKCDPHWGSFFHYSQNRTITVREAARLQSFPDRFRFVGSRVSQYEQVGNAVPPILAKKVAEHIKRHILKAGR